MGHFRTGADLNRVANQPPRGMAGEVVATAMPVQDGSQTFWAFAAWMAYP